MSSFDDLKGDWKHSSPWDSDDYLAVYSISGTEEAPVVEAKDLNDGERFEISQVLWNGQELTFCSYMPSTKRKGFNKFKLNEYGELTSEFTFTVVEYLARGGT